MPSAQVLRASVLMLTSGNELSSYHLTLNYSYLLSTRESGGFLLQSGSGRSRARTSRQAAMSQPRGPRSCCVLVALYGLGWPGRTPSPRPSGSVGTPRGDPGQSQAPLQSRSSLSPLGVLQSKGPPSPRRSRCKKWIGTERLVRAAATHGSRRFAGLGKQKIASGDASLGMRVLPRSPSVCRRGRTGTGIPLAEPRPPPLSQ